ncbi:ZN414 protein, partial [Urocolius indicus]|nr:ZN414 protein [Urocolius indicus]
RLGAHRPPRAARLTGGSATAPPGSSFPFPTAGTFPVRVIIVLESVPCSCSCSSSLGAVPVSVRSGAAPGAASPAAPRPGTRGSRLQRCLEEKPRCECQPTPPLLRLWRHSSSSRIVWEHTRGRYSCLQCPFRSASRHDMTLHVEEHRRNPPAPARLGTDVDFGVSLGSFHTKLPPEVENSLYSQL